MLVVDKQDYTNTSHELLVQRDNYRTLTVDPTNKHKNKLINLGRTIKAQGRTREQHLPKALPTRDRLPKILWATQNAQTGQFP